MRVQTPVRFNLAPGFFIYCYTLNMPRHGHHIGFYKREWSASPESLKIRQDHWLIPPLDREIHNALHDEVRFNPALSRYMATLALKEYRPKPDDYIGSIERLMFAIDIQSNNPMISDLEKSSAELTIHSIELQLPFIKEGLLHKRLT